LKNVLLGPDLLFDFRRGPLIAIGVFGISPEYTVPVISNGSKMAHRPCLIGFSDELPTMETEKFWPASFSTSAPLTGAAANVPEAVKVMFTPFSGLAAASLCEAAKQDIAAAAVVTHSIFRPSNENIRISFCFGRDFHFALPVHQVYTRPSRLLRLFCPFFILPASNGSFGHASPAARRTGPVTLRLLIATR